MKPIAWSQSTAEEVIAALWVIAAILCFGFNVVVQGAEAALSPKAPSGTVGWAALATKGER